MIYERPNKISHIKELPKMIKVNVFLGFNNNQLLIMIMIFCIKLAWTLGKIPLICLSLSSISVTLHNIDVIKWMNNYTDYVLYFCIHKPVPHA